MVAYIRSDLEFILAQIKIAEDHALYEQSGGTLGKPLFGVGASGQAASIPTYNLSWGLRTVDGSLNHLLPGQEHWGATDREFPELVPAEFRTVMVTPPGAPGPVPVTYTPGADNDGPGPAGPGDVFDPTPRTISNLIVDQTLGNPAPIVTALTRNGVAGDLLAIAASIMAAYEPLKPLFKAVDDTLDAYSEAQAALNVANPLDPGYAALQAAAAAALAAFNAAEASLAVARAPILDPLLVLNGIELSGANVVLPNVAPDLGLSAPFNSWFTLFGQFFDHGLDLVNKGGNGTVFIPLQPDDPLYNPDLDGPDNIAGNADDARNFMVLTRATTSPGADGVLGDNPLTPANESLDDGRPVNTTTSLVDQNQTYTSHPSHQVFLRAYVMTPNGPVATGKLIEGANGGMANWAEVKAQTASMLGIQLTDQDVGKVPLLRTDAYGNFIAGPNGFPLLVTNIGPDGIPNTSDDLTIPTDPAANGGFGTSLVGVVRTNMAFLADIAHNAVPSGLADGDLEIGLDNGGGSTDGFYDNELLDRHLMAGDGRVNENIGLTAVHHVFHSEHNRLVDHTKEVTVADAQAMLLGGASQAEATAFLNEWLAVDVTAVPTSIAEINGLVWDGERLFQAAKFGTEMQYQHLVFEEFARKITPSINVFIVPDGFETNVNPSIVAEFAHTVYRFGHSMLTETIDRFDAGFVPDHIGLIQGFLNPVEFDANGTLTDGIAAGDIIRGMTRQQGNHIDEFVTSALRNNLLGLPLDLPTINLARGRDTGVPSFNDARRAFYEMTAHNEQLKPFESWVEFAANLKNEASIINFIASYGTHALITGETTLAGKRDAALTLITGTAVGKFALDPLFVMPADADDFLNGLGAYGAANGLGGLDSVDLWIGGLAEKSMPFGGMLGATFQFVFETQMESLQNGDRFYYLQRLDGLHLFGEMEANSFASLIMRNTNATHLPSDVFSTPGLILEVDPARQFNDLNGDGLLEGGDPQGAGLLTKLVIRNNPATVGLDTNYLKYTGPEHVVLGGTDPGSLLNPSGNDILLGSEGDDTLHGDGGNDRLDGGFGNDIINGGAGDDIITDIGGDDNVKGGEGNDAIHGGPGTDLVLGGPGQDFVFLGTDDFGEVFGGVGNDFIHADSGAERILGNEGSDWLEGGAFSGAPGDNFDEIFARDGIDGNDVFLGEAGFDEFIGEGGDDIMVGSLGRGTMAGMSGFDWATYKDFSFAVNANLGLPVIFDENPTLPANSALERYEAVEGLSGSRFNDILIGTNDTVVEMGPVPAGGAGGFLGSFLDAEGISLINGLQDLLGPGVNLFNNGDIILGGDGSDVITGLSGDDIIDGDKWLDVQIGVFAANDTEHAGTPIALHSSMTTLATSMFNGTINPGQLGIIRTIRNSNDQPDSDGIADIDVAVFRDVRANYTISPNADGTITVEHVTVTAGLLSDGIDRVRNLETLRFSDVDVSLIKPVVDLHAFDVGGTYADTFASANYNLSTGTTPWDGGTTPWTETGDDNSPALAAAGQIQITGGNLLFDTGDGATITRTVPLAGAVSARITVPVVESSLEADDSIQLQFLSATGGTWVTVLTINNATNTSTLAADLPGPFTATSAIRFVASSLEAASVANPTADTVNINSVSIEFIVPAAPDGLNYTTSYLENAVGVAISNRPGITDDGATLASAKIVLTNAQPGDDFDIVGALPAGINATTDISVAGVITLNLTGTASLAAYRAAIAQVTFDSSSDNPGNVPRIIQTTVNDGFVESDPVTTTVNVTPVNDAPAGNNDTVMTNVAATVTFSIAQSALLANDTDPEGSVLTITGPLTQIGLNGLPVLGAGVINVADNAAANGSFTYNASDGLLTDPATVNITRVTTANIAGTGASEIIVGNTGANPITGGGGNDNINAGDGGDTISGGTGNDIILAGTGNDTVTWNANATGDTDGFDMVDGEAGGTDTFVLTGNAAAETFRIYTTAAAIAAGVPVQGALTEIVITRTVGLTTTVIAELDNIEEISVNTLNVTANNGGGLDTIGSGDTIVVSGDFTTTSLNFSTITIDGNAGDDTIDISSLDSAHRIVFRSNGGNDTIIGNLRPQDVIDLPAGTTAASFTTTTNALGVSTMTNGTHSITFTAPNGMPQIGEEVGTPPTAGEVTTGTPQSDVLMGTAGDDNIIAFAGDDVAMGNAGADAISAGEGGDFVSGGSGRDVIFAGAGDDQVLAGADDDIVYGDAGADRIFGDQGNDLINAGAGDDSVFGGAGNDLIVAEVGDGNDVYFGDEGGGGAGIDTLDMSAATANVTVNLGSGPLSNGTASSSQTGNDTIWGIENVNTGSGNDTITASNAVNVMNGGGGNDTFKFTSASAADGDTILAFEAGDRVDLTAIDANLGTAGDQSFSLVSSATFTAAGQLAVTFETRADGDFTVVQGNTGGSTDADFTIEIAGHQNLTNANLGL